MNIVKAVTSAIKLDNGDNWKAYLDTVVCREAAVKNIFLGSQLSAAMDAHRMRTCEVITGSDRRGFQDWTR